MSLLEVELETNMRRRLDTLAQKRGLPASVMVRQAVEKLVEDEEAQGKPKHSIMELHGIGKGTWDGVEVQDYINEMRDEWDAPR